MDHVRLSEEDGDKIKACEFNICAVAGVQAIWGDPQECGRSAMAKAALAVWTEHGHFLEELSK